MKITPDICGKYDIEVRDWKNNKTKKVKMRCNDKLNCSYCGAEDVRKYKSAISNVPEKHFYKVSNNDWDAVRKAISRSDSCGYARFPTSTEDFVLVTDTQLDREELVLTDSELDRVILRSFEIKEKNGKSLRRTMTGVFKNVDLDDGESIEVDWPEPIFKDKNGGNVPTFSVSRIVSDFLQYLSHTNKITPDNANEYLRHRARMKADIISVVEEGYVLQGFSTVSKSIPVSWLNNWNNIPVNDPSKRNTKGNSYAEKLSRIIFDGQVSDYEGADWNLPAWTDYEDEGIRLFRELGIE